MSAKASRHAAQRSAHTVTLSILVVEDEPAILELLRVNLVDAGYEVRAAADAESAQRELRTALPSLVLLDWMLPGKSGLALAKELRGDARTRVASDHHGDGAHRRSGQGRGPRGLGRRLRDQAVLAARVEGADQVGVAAARCRRRSQEPLVGRRAQARSDDASRDGRRRRRFRSAPPNSGCCGFCSRARSACIRERSSWTTCGAARRTSRSARSTSTSGDCGRRSSRSGRMRLIETVRGSGYRLAVPRRHPTDRRDEPRSSLPASAYPSLCWSLAALVALTLGAAMGFRRVLAVGLWDAHRPSICGRSIVWRGGPTRQLDAPGPGGRGAWGLAFSALYRRTRTRTERQRDLATTIERFQQCRRSTARRHGDPRRREPHPVGQSRGRRRTSASIVAKDAGRPLLNFMRQPEVVQYLETANFTDALVVDSQREPGTTLSIQVVPFGIDERLLISRNITQVEAVARMRRDFIANVSHELKTPLTVVTGFLETLQDMELEPRQRTRYLQLMTEQAKQHAAPRRRSPDAVRARKRAGARAETSFAVLPLLLECRRPTPMRCRAAGTEIVARRRRPRDRDGQPRRARERVRQSRQQRGPLYAGRRDDHARLARRRGRPRARSASPTAASASRPSTFRG